MKLKTDQLNFYLNEIFQLLNTKVSVLIEQFFLDYAKRSPLFSHQLIWQCKVEENTKPKDDRKYNQNHKKRREAAQLITNIMKNFTAHEARLFSEINTFLTQLTEISSKMPASMEKDKKIETIKYNLENIKLPKYAYLPTNPHMRIIEILKDTGKPMQSAAKSPFLLSFKCEHVRDIDILMREDSNNLKQLNTNEMEENTNKIEIRALKVNINHNTVHKDRHKSNLRHNGSNISITKSNMKLHNFDNISYMADKLKDTNFRISNRTINNLDHNFDSILFDSDKSFSYPDKRKYEHFRENKKLHTISCIFKTKDDVRNDTLTLKFMTLLKEIFDKEKVELYLKPYRTFSNRTGEVN